MSASLSDDAAMQSPYRCSELASFICALILFFHNFCSQLLQQCLHSEEPNIEVEGSARRRSPLFRNHLDALLSTSSRRTEHRSARDRPVSLQPRRWRRDHPRSLSLLLQQLSLSAPVSAVAVSLVTRWLVPATLHVAMLSVSAPLSSCGRRTL